jgi:hypothetical protein
MKNNHIDDDEEDLAGLGSSLEQYGAYTRLEVEEVTVSLREKAENLIEGISRIYTSTGTSIDDEFVGAIKSVETDALVSMLKQVKYAEHMLDTLMSRLDNGGFVDKEIYDQIKDMQRHVIEMNLEVTKYTRLLPEFFKFTESDVVSMQQKQFSSYQSTNVISNSSEVQTIEVHEATSITGPQFGTKGLLEAIEMMDSVSAIDDILENEPDVDLGFDPKDIEEKDEFDIDSEDNEENE